MTKRTIFERKNEEHGQLSPRLSNFRPHGQSALSRAVVCTHKLPYELRRILRSCDSSVSQHRSDTQKCRSDQYQPTDIVFRFHIYISTTVELYKKCRATRGSVVRTKRWRDPTKRMSMYMTNNLPCKWAA